MAGYASTLDSIADRCRVIEEKKAPIPGLLFRVSADRLADHCTDRAAYHKRRAEEKQSEIPTLEAAAAGLRESIDKIKGFAKDAEVPSASGKSMSNTSYNFQGKDQVNELENQIDKLRADIKDHLNKSAQFTFLADSFFTGIYALEWDNLARLELVK